MEIIRTKELGEIAHKEQESPSEKENKECNEMRESKSDAQWDVQLDFCSGVQMTVCDECDSLEMTVCHLCGDESHPESNKFRNMKGSGARVSPEVPEVGRGRRGGEAVLLFLGDAWLNPESVVG